jgi:starch phosphorylase
MSAMKSDDWRVAVFKCRQGNIRSVLVDFYAFVKDVEGVTGWAIVPSPKEIIGEDERRKHELEDLFNKLECLIIPKVYEERYEWLKMMKNSIGKIAYYFNTDRMMRRYITEAYLV